MKNDSNSMMETPLFSIENLTCSYDRSADNKVLHIDRLVIPKGKLVFLLGASGCGKSTLLETLGLMNNTVASGNIFLSTASGSDKINLPDLWNEDKAIQLTEVRKKYYSFIFQNTNLMENFTAYENVCLSGMIKKNVRQSAVLEGARILMEKIKLPENEVNLQTLAVNLSGGQRQRLAFARALNNDASILFGDEPTGNLDEANANELFGIIRSNLNNNLSAIVVSHDINLAVKYADQIIVITKELGKNYGEVRADNIFNSESWQNCSSEDIDLLKNKLRVFYKTDSEHKVSKVLSHVRTDTTVSYAKLFLKKEGRELLGKKLSNFLILSLILTFTFLAIGFANGSLDYLNKQLNDAFVNWIPISIPSSQSGRITPLLQDLNDPENKGRYLINKATPYVKSPVRVLDIAKGKFNYAISRSVDVAADADLIKGFVLAKDNVIESKISTGFKDANDIGVIVTKNFLAEFSYPEDANFIYCPFLVKDTIANNSRDIPVRIPVRAIVKRLPGKYGVLYPLFFYQSLMYNRDNIFDSTTRVNDLSVFLETDDPKKAIDFGKSLGSFFNTAADLKKYGPRSVFKSSDTLGFEAGYKFDVGFDSSINDLQLMNGITSKIKAYIKNDFDTAKIVRYFDYSGITEFQNYFRYDEVSVYFAKLDSIGVFRDYLYNKADAKNNSDIIQLDDAKVKDKENFLFLSNVTKIISTLLVIFSTLAVCLFIFNLLKSHLAKVKMNIGTFKAIGLTDRESRNIYFKIIILFISISSILSVVFAVVLGTGINVFLTNHKNEANNIKYFKLFDFIEKNSIVNFITLLTILIVFVSTLIMSWSTIRKILSKTPGDLIYNR